MRRWEYIRAAWTKQAAWFTVQLQSCVLDWEDYKERREHAGMNVNGGESCFPTVQESVEADVMERESEQTRGSLWSFELTLERIKRDAAVLTGLCCTASPDRSAC